MYKPCQELLNTHQRKTNIIIKKNTVDFLNVLPTSLRTDHVLL